jgi:hypothetical protein
MAKTISTPYAWENHLSSIDYCAVVDLVIEERSPTAWLSLTNLQTENHALHCFTTSPGFVNAAGHDFHLLSSSPCINAGVFVGLTQDYEGNSIEGTPDIGVYESGPPI